jgi:uncharacterized protein
MIGQLAKGQCLQLLVESFFGHIGCNDGFNTYVFPTNYMFDGKHIICHSQPGSKVEVMRRNKRICFQVDTVKDFTHWKSVMVLGEYQELQDTRERYHAMKAFLDNMLHLKQVRHEGGVNAPGKTMHPELGTEMNYVIYRVLMEEISGRYEGESPES